MDTETTINFCQVGEIRDRKTENGDVSCDSLQGGEKLFDGERGLAADAISLGGSYGDLLDANEVEGFRRVAVLEAELDSFADAPHQGIQVFCLGVAALQGRNGGDVVAGFVALDEDGEFAFWFHGRFGKSLAGRATEKRPLNGISAASRVSCGMNLRIGVCACALLQGAIVRLSGARGMDHGRRRSGWC